MHDDASTSRAEALRRRDAARTGRDVGAPPEMEVAALRYDASGGDHAPTLVARGRGAIAERIMELAEQHDVPVTRDPTLVAVLGALDIGEEIPPDLYGVIAEVLAWAYHADRQVGDQRARRSELDAA